MTPPVDAVTVIDVPDAFSSTLDGEMDTEKFGVSSSVSFGVAPWTVRSVEVPATVKVSSPSTRVSAVGVSVNVPVPLVCPAVIVMSKPVTAA